jgi:ABC-2 type transport system permease protein
MSTAQPDQLQIQPPRFATWRKYYRVWRVSLAERMTYRADFLLGTFLRMLPMVTTILLWQAIYQGSGQTTLAGFQYREMIAYLLLVHISRMFSSMPGLASGIAREIREGTLKKYLIQPLDLLGYLISYRAAHKITYIVTAALPYGIIFYLCRGFFVLSFLIGFYFEAAVGMVAFWIMEVTSVLYIVITLNYFISGQMLPLDLLPEPWAGFLKAMPFQFMAYFPAVVFLGKVQGADLAWGLALEAFWALFFALLARFLYRRGLRHYGAYGG